MGHGFPRFHLCVTLFWNIVEWDAPPVPLPQRTLQAGWRGWFPGVGGEGGSYLHKLHVAEDVDRVVGSVEVVAATAQLAVAPPKVTAFTTGRLRAVQRAAARRGAVHCRW